MRILLVDDENDIRELAGLALSKVGNFEVTPASSGLEAIELAKQGEVDAVLLDVMMPDMDGPATLKALRADPLTKKLPIIFLTAKVQPSDRKTLEELGALGVLSKPFDPMSLSQEVERLLQEKNERA